MKTVRNDNDLKMKRINANISLEKHTALKVKAARKDKKINDLIIEWIDEFLESNNVTVGDSHNKKLEPFAIMTSDNNADTTMGDDDLKPQTMVCVGEDDFQGWFVGMDKQGYAIVEIHDRCSKYTPCDISQLYPCPDISKAESYLKNHDMPVTDGNIDLVERMADAGLIGL